MISGGFSGAVKLTGLDDFITPSLECIKPVESSKTSSSTKPSVRIWKNGDSEVNLSSSQKATISLTDCLACAGCVTTAESVLVEAQSTEELRRRFEAKGSLYDVMVVSLSTQSIISLAHKLNMSSLEVSKILVNYFKSLGADYVYSLKACEDISLQEQSQEMLMHITEGHKGPLLSSSCPGWICYAEKTHGEWILPYISKVKSPQQIMGTLVKSWCSHRVYKTSPDRICHVTVMPCFDKKLEASRKDFMDEKNVPDVDLVTTSIELEQMIRSDNVSLDCTSELPMFDAILKESTSELRVNHGSGSGGFCETIFLNTIKSLFDDSDPSLKYKVIRNQDFLELKYEKEGRKLRFGVANGFRNIQNIVQMLKRKKCDFDFIEIMACPSGCLNGGAQATHEGQIGNKEYIQTLKSLYESLPRSHSSNTHVPKDLYSELKPLFYTQYHAVPRETNGLNIQW